MASVDVSGPVLYTMYILKFFANGFSCLQSTFHRQTQPVDMIRLVLCPLFGEGLVPWKREYIVTAVASRKCIPFVQSDWLITVTLALSRFGGIIV